MSKYLVLTDQPSKRVWKKIKYGIDNFVGVESGSNFLINKKIIVEFLASDFDSVKQSQRREIDRTEEKVIYLSPEKDLTDLEYSLEKIGKSNDVIAYVKGDRVDHFVVQQILCHKYPKLKIVGENFEMELLNKKINKIEKEDFKMFSLMSSENSNITIDNAKYEAKSINVNRDTTLCISNEWLDTEEDAKITINKGSLLVIKTN